MKKLIYSFVGLFILTNSFAQEAADKKVQAGLIFGSGIAIQKMGTNYIDKNGVGSDLTIGANVNFSLTAYVRYMDDGLQLAEQILPYFTPDFTIAIKQNVLGETGERMNVPIVLNGVSQNIEYEGAMDLNPRIIMWDYSFTARINLFGPLVESPIITYTGNNIFDISELENI